MKTDQPSAVPSLPVYRMNSRGIQYASDCVSLDVDYNLASDVDALLADLARQRAQEQEVKAAPFCVQVDFSCLCSSPVFEGDMNIAHCDLHRDGRPIRIRVVSGTTWKCFHCGEVFTTIGSARDHFGATPESTTGCLIDHVALEEGGKPERGRGLQMALRKVEAQLTQAQETIERLTAERDTFLKNYEGWFEIAAQRLTKLETAEAALAALRGAFEPTEGAGLHECINCTREDAKLWTRNGLGGPLCRRCWDAIAAHFQAGFPVPSPQEGR